MASPYGALRTHSDTPQSEGLLCVSAQPVAETSTWQHTTLTTDRQTAMPAAGFGPTTPENERSQTDALDCAATGIGIQKYREL
jgi:hypothetical protein